MPSAASGSFCVFVRDPECLKVLASLLSVRKFTGIVTLRIDRLGIRYNTQFTYSMKKDTISSHSFFFSMLSRVIRQTLPTK